MINEGRLRITPFDLRVLRELHIDQAVNGHARLRFKGDLKTGDTKKIDQYTTASPLTIHVDHVDDFGSVINNLFTGCALNVSVQVAGNIYTIEGEGVSFTRQVDTQPRRRSFQDPNMTFGDLVSVVTGAAAHHGTVQSNVGQDLAGTPIGNFLLQYDETDWEFLMRAASQFGAVLTADNTAEKPRFWAGLPHGKEYQLTDLGAEAFYLRGKYVNGWRGRSLDQEAGGTEQDFVYYEIHSFKPMRIGDRVMIDNVGFAVAAMTGSLEAGAVRFVYHLVSPGDLRQRRLFNQRLKGACLSGTVLAVKDDRIKLHLDVDAEQKESTAYVFPMGSRYAATGHTGWYCMPEQGDRVTLFFPSLHETDAYGTASIRQEATDQSKDPDIKYFRTKYDKELKCSPQELSFAGTDNAVLIRLNVNSGIEITGKQDIKIVSDTNIEINVHQDAGITAGNDMEFICGASSVSMNNMLTLKSSRIDKNTIAP